MEENCELKIRGPQLNKKNKQTKTTYFYTFRRCNYPCLVAKTVFQIRFAKLNKTAFLSFSYGSHPPPPPWKKPFSIWPLHKLLFHASSVVWFITWRMKHKSRRTGTFIYIPRPFFSPLFFFSPDFLPPSPLLCQLRRLELLAPWFSCYPISGTNLWRYISSPMTSRKFSVSWTTHLLVGFSLMTLWFMPLVSGTFVDVTFDFVSIQLCIK